VCTIDPSTQLILEYEKLLYKANFQYWVNNVAFTPRWWILLGLLVVPWIAWYSLVDKKRIVEMLVYGALMSGIILLIDEIGSELTLWAYPVKITPLFPHLMPLNYSLAPIIYMLLYQYFPKWKSFIIAAVITSTVLTLILLPLATRWSFLILLKWKYVYSTFIFIIAALISKLFIETVNTIENKSAT